MTPLLQIPQYCNLDVYDTDGLGSVRRRTPLLLPELRVRGPHPSSSGSLPHPSSGSRRGGHVPSPRSFRRRAAVLPTALRVWAVTRSCDGVQTPVLAGPLTFSSWRRAPPCTALAPFTLIFSQIPGLFTPPLTFPLNRTIPAPHLTPDHLFPDPLSSLNPVTPGGSRYALRPFFLMPVTFLSPPRPT